MAICEHSSRNVSNNRSWKLISFSSFPRPIRKFETEIRSRLPRSLIWGNHCGCIPAVIPVTFTPSDKRESQWG